MAKKEKVIIFEGEDKFVKPRHHSYDMNTGKAEFVGVDSAPSTDPNQEVRDNIGGGSPGSAMPLPQLGSPNFCAELSTYISTNGGGKATPEQTMAAYDMFQRYCNKPEDTTTTSTTTSTTTAPPIGVGTNVVVPVVPVTNLGLRPMGGGAGGGGGDEAPVEKKKNYWWLLLVALGIYLVAKKKKD